MKHDKVTCRMAFGRPSPAGICPRCDELRNGAEPRTGWRSKRADAATDARWIREHNCRVAGCGPICTAFDW
jgi:hypothetical protein